ncbi:MAG: hypothetical protein GX456_03980 [Verrucomicrobia bacterium]|nr:hypothetical protein [Verrucomicrobiota bacterium]
MGVGSREAFGVRQLAAALFSCTSNVSVPISHIPHQPDDRRRVSIPQIGPPNIHRLGAAKNRRAPAGALQKAPSVGSAAVLGRINVTTDPTTRLDHANAAPEHSPAGDAPTTCLSPYRHPRGSSADFGNCGLEQGTICSSWRYQGATPKQRACHSILAHTQTKCLSLYLLTCWTGVGGKRHVLNQFTWRRFRPQWTKWRRSGHFERVGPCTESTRFQFDYIAPHALSV